MTDQLAAPIARDALPPTPAEATARLESLKADPAWRDKFLAGGIAQVAEYGKLSEIAVQAANGDHLDKAIAGQLLPGGLQPSGHVLNIHAAAMLREANIRPEIIKDVLAGTHKVSQAEYDATARWRAERMKDHEWVKRYLAGDGEAVQKLTLAQIILTGGIRDEKAA